MASLNGFNAADVEPTADRGPLPAGTYTAAIVESQMKPTKAGTGEMLEIVLEVIDGEHKGRRVWDRLNLRNPSETAVDIAKRTLSAICRSVGVLTPKDSSDLHDRPLVITVVQEEYEGKVSNKVKGYRAATPAPAPAARTPAKPANAAAPWKR
jgi:hypothetical protein